MSLSEPLPLANAQLELGRSQVIKLEEEMAVVIGEGHTCMVGPSRDRRELNTAAAIRATPVCFKS